VVESAGEMPALPSGDSPFVICRQLGENAGPVAQDVATLFVGDKVAVGESVVTVFITGYAFSLGRAFFRFLFVLLLLLLPEAFGLGLVVPCDLFTAPDLGRAAWK